MADAAPSDHPVDQLIRELIRTERAVLPAELGQIRERIATAPFNPQIRNVPEEQRGTSYQGRRVQAREPSLFQHLVKRVLDERQWAVGTSEAEYQHDLRSAARAATRVALYHARGGHLASAIARTDEAVPLARRGPRTLPLLLVVYSADRGTILTGYQISALQAATIPREARWLTYD
jgi:hypothetical protein